MMFVRENRIDS